MSEIYTTAEAARVLGVDPDAVRYAIRAGYLPASLEGITRPTYRVAADALADYARRFRRAAPHPAPVRGGYYTSGDVARITGVCPRVVNQWADAGRIRHHRLPGSGERRYQPADVRAFLAANGLPVPAWLAGRPLLLAIASSPLPWLEGAAAGWDVLRVPCLFAAGQVYEARRPRAVLLDPAVGRSTCATVAACLSRADDAPVLLALSQDDAGPPDGCRVVAGPDDVTDALEGR